MKIKSLTKILLLILFLIPVSTFSGEWVPMNSGTTNTLYGIWGSSSMDVFAVGYGGTILHYDGVKWSVMNSGTTKYLLGVWGSAGTDVFAVGEAGTILHFDGIDWSPMESGTTLNLYDVEVNNRDSAHFKSTILRAGECDAKKSARVESCGVKS
jgi:hypothetical protein